jgi:hypothetical protein
VLSNNDACCGPNVLSDKWDLGMSSSRGHETLGGPSHHDLVQAAVLAPSPDNNQPWRFVSTQGALEVFLDRERSLPSDVNSMYDLMSIGAGMENLSIQARHDGFHTDVQLSPSVKFLSADDPAPHLATLTFRAGATPDSLHDFLATRCTNRKLFSSRAVEPRQFDAMSGEIGAFPDIQLNWITDRKVINTLARLIAQSDRFRFEYQPFHGEIFRQLRFTAEQAERTRDGLDFRTMEMPPGSSIIIRGLRSWKRMQWVNRLGLGRLLTVPSWLSVRKCGAIGAISIPAPSIQGFVTGGRAFQRIWLASESQGLALHPQGSLPIFIGQMEQLGGKNLHAAHQSLSRKLNDWFRRLVPATQDRTLLMLFRIGYARRPRIQSLRHGAEEVMKSV